MSTERESTGGGVVLVDPLGGLVLDPSNELRFKGPFDDYVTVSLTIRNPTEKRIAFKIKTTAPKRYCVKPNSGVLDPGQLMKVNGKKIFLIFFIINEIKKKQLNLLPNFKFYFNHSIMIQMRKINTNLWFNICI